MLIELLLKDFLKLEKDRNFLYIGILSSIIGFLIGYSLFPENNLAIIFFTTMPLLPMTKSFFLKKLSNRQITKAYGLLFFGMLIVFIATNYFSSQVYDITQYESVSYLLKDPYIFFSYLVMHNLKIIFVLFVLSILYGIGSLFILTLNAATIGRLFASFFAYSKYNLAISFIPHTTLEFLSFFLAAIAGALMAMSFSAYKKPNKEFEHSVLRSSIFFTLSVSIMIVSAFLESFLLPWLILSV